MLFRLKYVIFSLPLSSIAPVRRICMRPQSHIPSVDLFHRRPPSSKSLSGLSKINISLSECHARPGRRRVTVRPLFQPPLTHDQLSYPVLNKLPFLTSLYLHELFLHSICLKRFPNLRLLDIHRSYTHLHVLFRFFHQSQRHQSHRRANCASHSMLLQHEHQQHCLASRDFSCTAIFVPSCSYNFP